MPGQSSTNANTQARERNREVERRIAEWHGDLDDDRELHEALGWPLPAYRQWVETGQLPLLDRTMRKIGAA